MLRAATCSRRELDLFAWQSFLFCSVLLTDSAQLRCLLPRSTMEPAHDVQGSAPSQASSTLLSLECPLNHADKPASVEKPANNNPCAQMTKNQLSLVNTSNDFDIDGAADERSGENNNINNEAEHDIDTSNGLQGSMIFDMLSAMQFNVTTTASTSTGNDATNNFLSVINATQPKLHTVESGSSAPWLLNINCFHNPKNADMMMMAHEDHDADNYLASSKDQFDPIGSFLKLPMLSHQAKLGFANQKIASSILACNYNEKSSPKEMIKYGNVENGHNNNWVSSLQLESIRSPIKDPGIDHEDAHQVVQYLEHPHEMKSTIDDDSTLEEAKLLMKLNCAQDQELSSQMSDQEPMGFSDMGSYGDHHHHYTTSDVGFHEDHDAMMSNIMMMSSAYCHGHLNQEKHKQSDAAKSYSGTSAPLITKRRRGGRGGGKNSEERETQRMTHIAVERNRRRQMNEHLRVLRALMPPSYIQRGDQASIIGGAIEFVRELEQLLQCLESQKRRRIMANPANLPSISAPLQLHHDQHQPTCTTSDAALLMQYPLSTGHVMDEPPSGSVNLFHEHGVYIQQEEKISKEMTQLEMVDDQMQNASILQHMQLLKEDHDHEVAQAKSSLADIEVKVVGRSEAALIKILSQRRPRQLLLTITALQEHLNFTILHTNVTTIDNTVLYSFTVQVNAAICDTSAQQIATIVHETFVQLINQVPIEICNIT